MQQNGHRIVGNRTQKREDAPQPQPHIPNSRPQRPTYNQKLECDNFGYTVHSARDCGQKMNTTSAYRNLPYDKQITEENRGLRNNFGKTIQRQYPAKARHESEEANISSASKSDHAEILN